MKYLNEKEVAEMTGIAVSTLQNDRACRRRLPYYKIGKSVRYSIDDVKAFMEGHRVSSDKGQGAV